MGEPPHAAVKMHTPDHLRYRHRVGFDEARLIRQQRIMRKNGIGALVPTSQRVQLTTSHLQIRLQACPLIAKPSRR